MLIKNISKSFDTKVLFENASFSINKNDKIGIVGKNGTGKSTLLKILNNNISCDKGKIENNNESVKLFKQEIEINNYDFSIGDYIKNEIGILQIEKDLIKMQNNIEQYNEIEYQKMFDVYMLFDGYNFEDNVTKILNGLGMKKSLDTPIKELSGGEKMKLSLCIVLIASPDIMLLDEPINNLDLQSTQWLENYLLNSNKSMLVVSHDEIFLDTICNKILEIADSKIKIFNTKYFEYKHLKEIEYNTSEENFNKQLEKQDKLKRSIRKLNEWTEIGINKKSTDNDKVQNDYKTETTASDRTKKLKNELEKIELPEFNKKYDIIFKINFDEQKNNDITFCNAICGYENFKIFPITLKIPYGSKTQILGNNGSGKTTIIKTLLNQIPLQSGKINIGSGAKIGYITQNTIDNDNQDITVFDYVTQNLESVDLKKQGFVFTVLRNFGIGFEYKNKKFITLSSGERTKLNLAKLSLEEVNILILDEVTNHIDLDTLQVIYEVINNFKGTIINISHNRQLNEIFNPNIIIDLNTCTITKHSDYKF